jgi:ParB family chromosome partitioning protein
MQEEVIPNVYHRDSIFWVEVDRIKPNPYQPRREFDEAKLKELSESIRMYGLLQPLTVTRSEIMRDDGGLFVEYELIAGERRLRASKLAGLVQVPVIIRTGEQTDQMKLELAIIENLQREDLNPIDRAKAFERLVNDFGFKHTSVAEKVGKSRVYVSNTIRLLGLPEEMQQLIVDGKITEGHTRPILMLGDKPEEQQVLVKEILLKKLTVREAEAIARRVAQDKVRRDKYRIDPSIMEIERKLMDRLGTRVHIEPKENGGRLIISFFSADDLAGLLTYMDSKEALPVPDASQTTDALSGAEETENEPELLDDRSVDERDEAEEELYSIKNFSI